MMIVCVVVGRGIKKVIMTTTIMHFGLGSLQFVSLDGSPHFMAPVISEPEKM